MKDYSNYWVLRSGDLHAEKASTIGLLPKACAILEQEGLLFSTRQEAEMFRKVMLRAINRASA